MDIGTQIKAGKLRIDLQPRRLLGRWKLAAILLLPYQYPPITVVILQQNTHLDLNQRIVLLKEDN